MLEAYKLAFMAQVIPAAIKVCTPLGVPYQICCAQAALESGWGKAAAHYNYWGIKGSGDAGSQNWTSKEYKGDPQNGGYEPITAAFAKFSSPEAAFEAYAKMVSSGTFFNGSTAYAYDPSAFICYLWASGYASDPDYVATSIGVCRTFYNHLDELNQLSDSKLEEFDVTRAEADAAVAHMKDFDLHIAPAVKNTVAILKRVPIGKDRREMRDKIFMTDKLLPPKQNVAPALAAGALLLWLVL